MSDNKSKERTSWLDSSESSPENPQRQGLLAIMNITGTHTRPFSYPKTATQYRTLWSRSVIEQRASRLPAGTQGAELIFALTDLVGVDYQEFMAAADEAKANNRVEILDVLEEMLRDSGRLVVVVLK